MTRILFFDCDSTLSAIEGIDELARIAGPEKFRAVEKMTTDAMEGRLRVDEVFARRLEIIQPTAAMVRRVGELYIEQIEPDARATIPEVRRMGWTPVILSGGFRQAIVPLAEFLEVECVEAVDLFFDANGNYTGFDKDYPTTRSGGKPQRIRQLQAEWQPDALVMVGDGVSDLEAAPVVNLFVGFGRYAVREKVQQGATHFIRSLSELPALLPKRA